MIQTKVQDPASVIIKRLQKCQSTGYIQLDNLELGIFPKEIPNIAELRFDSQKWWDIVPITKIDLSNNKIKEIPEDIVNLNEVVSFRMLNNALEFLPESLFLITTLKSVDLSNNQIKQLPPTFIRCSSLVEVNMRHNKLEILPTHFGGLWNLEVLDLSENNIKTFRLSEGDFPKLKRLDLSKNQIQTLDAGLGSLTELEYLNLSKNKIYELPQNVFRSMRNLKLIDLKENKLERFEEFPQDSKLDSLLLSFNQLKIVRGLQNVPYLTVLDLKNNKLERLDPSLSSLKELKTLDVSNNDLTDIPSEVGFMTKLVRISLEGNPLKSIRSSVRSAGTEALKKYLRERVDTSQATTEIVQDFSKINPIDVYDQFIKDFLVSGRELTVQKQNIPIIPDKFCSLNLTVLDLSNNNITEINPNISKLYGLQKLRLNSNKLTGINWRILAQLENLEELELKNNKLRDEPELMGQSKFLQELKHLDFSQNKFERIPKFITTLSKLRVLVFAYNLLTTIDDLFVPELGKLETLDVSNNKIERIDDSIIVLEKLQQLNCENNNISNFPTILSQMKSLKSLLIYGNPIKNIRREVVSKGSKHILDFLLSKHPIQYGTTMEIEQRKEPPMSTRMEEEYSNEKHSFKPIEVNPLKVNPQQTFQNPLHQNIPMKYQPENYQAGSRYEESKVSYEQKGPEQSDIRNEIKALEASISQLENELQENFTLSTAQIMKKKKEINILRSRKNVLTQQL